MINCIAIDDEPLALRQIASYVEKTPELNLVESFDNAIDARTFLQDNTVELMFVDINMPDLNGMDFVKSLTNAPRVIFTTAYSEYAIDGFKVNAIDYLLKPISYGDFLLSIDKAKAQIETPPVQEEIKLKDDFLFIKSEYKVVRIKLSDITYIESMREYVRIHLLNTKAIMTLTTMKKVEQSLSQPNFMRVHRSYIVNLDQVGTVERNRIVFDKDTYIPISEQYQTAFKAFLDKNFLD